MPFVCTFLSYYWSSEVEQTVFHMFKIASFPPEDVNRLCGFPPAQADPARRSKGSRVISVKSFPTLEGNKIIDTRQEVKRNSDKIEKTNPMCFSLRSWGHLVENFLNFCNFYGRKNNSYLLRSSEVQKAKNSNIPQNLVKWETGQTCFQIINLNIVTLLHWMLFLLCSLMLIAACNNR